MIKYCKLLISCIFLFSLTACSDFLEESSQDEVRPSTISDLMELMVGEGYPMDGIMDTYLDFLTDDIKCMGAQNAQIQQPLVERCRPVFTWDKLFVEEMSSSRGMNSWQIYYERIKGCNVVIDYVDKVDGEIANRENLRGQALTMRGYYYFILVNLYGKPYGLGNPQTDLGVPLKLTMEVTDDFFARNTVEEVYQQVIKDLKAGNELLEKYDLSMAEYKVGHLAAKAMLSRVYLYMENWDEALNYANAVLKEKPQLAKLSNFPSLNAQNNNSSVYDPSISPEVIWAYGGKGERLLYSSAAASGIFPAYLVSEELNELYESVPFSATTNLKDLRSRMFFYNNGAIINYAMIIYKQYGAKGGSYGNFAGKGIRTAELYLNRAEVYIRKYQSTGEEQYRQLALADLNKLRESRYDTRSEAYVEIDIQNADELMKFYKDERRRELNAENHRWFDLRRYGMPSITHIYKADAGVDETHVLEEGDSRYVLQIPSNAMMANPLLVQNP